MSCVKAPYANDRFEYVKCEFPPHLSGMVLGDYANKGALLIPVTGNKLKLRAHFDGYSARPLSCDDWSFASYTEVVTRNCPDHYPDVMLHGGGTGSWGGAYQGSLPYSRRIAAMFKYAADNYGERIDWNAGITLEGCSYGGSTSLLQSILMTDVWTKALISSVVACVPPTLMMKQTTPIGNYWRDAGIQKSWGGFDWTLGDIQRHVNENVYYRINGSPSDTSVVFDLDFFRLCDEKEIACFGTWHDCGHNPNCPGINLPFYEKYSGAEMEVRLDKPLIIFTHATSNHWGSSRGHYNLGLEYRTGGITRGSNFLSVPLRYRAHHNLGGDIPNQAGDSTFNITMRRTRLQDGDYRWSLDGRTGTCKVLAGSLRIERITLSDNEVYSELRIFK